MNNWSAGYEAIRTYVRFAFWLSHERVVVTGRNNIPNGKPIIFAANHQNALMDPLAISCTNSLQSLWLARADIFKSKAARSFLKYIKMLPVYRIRDGKDNLSNNEQIFGQVIQLLEDKQSVALFPEAAHSGKRQMVPHRKAIPRIALDAEAKNNFALGLQIVPVGINYSHYWQFSRTLIVHYGEPIEVDRYKNAWNENPQKAMLSLRDEIHDKIIPLTIQINSQTFYREYEDIRQLAGETYSKTKHFDKDNTLNQFYAEQELIARIELLENTQPEQFEKIIDETRKYFQKIKEYNLTNEQIGKTGKAKWARLFVQIAAGIIAFPVFVLGFVFNAIPFFIPRVIFLKKVKDTAFMSTFNFVAGLVLFPVFYLIGASLIFALTGSSVISLVSFFVMPFAGKLAFTLLQFYKNLLKCVTIKGFNNALLKQLTKQRDEVIRSVLKATS
ncbi:MAG: hypothetical protein A2066_18450 [Bacteroidetes bacterium GWB2_41_8]|nr:MAG: hypothetical protein A2066_18450 [Bacteroidetes bacterium GWB2_41_8]